MAYKIVSKVREAQWAEKFHTAVKKRLAESGEADDTDTQRG